MLSSLYESKLHRKFETSSLLQHLIFISGVHVEASTLYIHTICVYCVKKEEKMVSLVFILYVKQEVCIYVPAMHSVGRLL